MYNTSSKGLSILYTIQSMHQSYFTNVLGAELAKMDSGFLSEYSLIWMDFLPTMSNYWMWTFLLIRRGNRVKGIASGTRDFPHWIDWHGRGENVPFAVGERQMSSRVAIHSTTTARVPGIIMPFNLFCKNSEMNPTSSKSFMSLFT